MHKENITNLKESPFSLKVYSPIPSEGLIESIKENNVLVPIWIDENKTIISGHRRVNACKKLGLREIPVEIKTYSDRLVLESNNYREKTWREKVNESHALKELLKPKAEERKKAGKKLDLGQNSDQGRTAQKIATALNTSRDTLYKAQFIAKERPELLAKIDQGETTIHSAHSKIVKEKRREELENNPVPFPTGKFRVIYADPPWQYKNSGFPSSAEAKYATMATEEICQLPVNDLTTGNAVLFIWGTNPMLEDTLKVVKAWGFEYKTNFSWNKNNTTAGFYNLGKHELLFVATKGSCLPNAGSLVPSVLDFPRTIHSKKPEEVQELIESMYSGPYIELFARNQTPKEGWTYYGNEVFAN